MVRKGLTSRQVAPTITEGRPLDGMATSGCSARNTGERRVLRRGAAAHPALVGNGSTSVVRCNASAHIAPQTAYSRQAPGYEIATVRITSGPGCSGMKFRLSLLD